MIVEFPRAGAAFADEFEVAVHGTAALPSCSQYRDREDNETGETIRWGDQGVA